MVNINNNFIYKFNENTMVKLPYTDFNQEASIDFRKSIPSIILKQKRSALVLDFSNVKFVDAEGMGALTYAWHLCSDRNILIILCNVNNLITSLLIEKGLTKLVEILPSLNASTKRSQDYTKQMKALAVAQSRLDAVFGSYEQENSDEISTHIFNITQNDNLKIG